MIWRKSKSCVTFLQDLACKLQQALAYLLTDAIGVESRSPSGDLLWCLVTTKFILVLVGKS